MPSLREIASQSGVSTATVSRALNSHPQVNAVTREKVIRAAQSLGYRASTRNEGTDGVLRVGLVYPGAVWISMHSPFDTALVRGFAQSMSETDFEVSLFDLRRRLKAGESYGALLRRRGISAAVLRSDDSTLHICERIANEGVPTVMVGERPSNESVSYITGASGPASREAVEHLIALGHKRIAICVNNVLTTDHHDRIRGWEDALAAHGLEARPQDRIQIPAALGNGSVLLRKLMSITPRPTAVFVTDPMLGLGLINEARVAGVRVPEDLSVVGVDDDNLRLLSVPGMSAVCQDAAGIGRMAVSVLRQMLDGASDGPVHMHMDAWFELRESTAAPNEAWSNETNG
jgi:DNA-binding LacI/PurR family transcriptional regulator